MISDHPTTKPHDPRVSITVLVPESLKKKLIEAAADSPYPGMSGYMNHLLYSHFQMGPAPNGSFRSAPGLPVKPFSDLSEAYVQKLPYIQKHIMQLHLQGLNLYTIAKTLNNARILSPRGKTWYHTSVKRVLENILTKLNRK